MDTGYKLCGLIEQLVLDYCNLSDRDIHHFCSTMLPHCKTLRVLSLQGAGISTSGVISLAIALWDGHLAQLSILRLDDNRIKQDGVKLLATALSRCRYLTSLSLSSNPIGDWGVYHVLKALLNRHRWLYSRFPKPSRIQCLSADHRLLKKSSLILPFTYYPPRQLPCAVIQSSTRFSFVVIEDRPRALKLTRDDDTNRSRLPTDARLSNPSAMDEDEDNDDEEEEYEDEIENSEELMSITSHYIGSMNTRSSNSLTSQAPRQSNKLSMKNPRSIDPKNLILNIFRNSKDAKTSSSKDKLDDEAYANDSDFDDTFSMSEE
jgi:hypothetical protein